jgi:hypothetical protein
VVDAQYGDAIRALSRDRHVWAVKSPVNDPVIEEVWASAPHHWLVSGVTAFNAGHSAEDSCLSILGVIEEHHGPYSHDPPLTEIEVVGVQPTAALRE